VFSPECLNARADDAGAHDIRDGSGILYCVRCGESRGIGPAVQLTDRERQIVHAAGRGLSNDAIAQTYGISAQTVKNHLTAAFQKLGVENRTGAVTALRRIEGD
jgi:DNA-binding NarL/FixJ family response regulator